MTRQFTQYLLILLIGLIWAGGTAFYGETEEPPSSLLPANFKGWSKPDEVTIEDLIYPDALSRWEMVRLAEKQTRRMGFNPKMFYRTYEETPQYFIVYYSPRDRKAQKGGPVIIFKRLVGMVVAHYVERPVSGYKLMWPMEEVFRQTDSFYKQKGFEPEKFKRGVSATQRLIMVTYWPRLEDQSHEGNSGEFPVHTITHPNIVFFSKSMGKAVTIHRGG